ncbi:MAG TPA: sugar transferase [candidate division Zixibacteria bacterium]|nr:sugar transferase [candidate division Zixibacteria bacterium]
MRNKNLFHDQPLKRNDSLSHNRNLTISIGGTGQFAFGHSFRYLTHKLWLAISGQSKRGMGAIGFLMADKVFSSILLFAFISRTLFMPRGLEVSFAGVCKRACIGIKSVADFFASLIGLILLTPLFLIIALLIKLDSSGPVFYSQVRVGIDRRKSDRRSSECLISEDKRRRDRRRKNYYGRPFRIIKFRTMVENAERKCGPAWAIENDPRITRVGSFLRKTRLDELPQLFNVLKGEMSLIGPRPERPMFIEDFSSKVENYTLRMKVKPGITGLAQVENGYDSSVDTVKSKIAYDLCYIRDWSLWQDIKILLKTVVVVITGKGAF